MLDTCLSSERKRHFLQPFLLWHALIDVGPVTDIARHLPPQFFFAEKKKKTCQKTKGQEENSFVPHDAEKFILHCYSETVDRCLMLRVNW